jgi:ubiquitin-protein ligase E3 C
VSDGTSILHLLANLLTFLPPRYTSTNALFKDDALEIYLSLLNDLIGRLPVGSMEAAKTKESRSMVWRADDSDEDEPAPRRRMDIDSYPAISPPDATTAKRLLTLVSKSHIASLLTATEKSAQCWPHFIQLIINIGIRWPSKREEVLSTIAVTKEISAANGSFVFKRLWRESVRSSPLGKDEKGSFLRSEKYKNDWPPLLMLTDLYTQALLTMDDDEFFSTTARTNDTVAARNPFNIGEVILFSRQLLNIVFPLYLIEDSGAVETGQIFGLPISWGLLRERITKCLQAIHAREYVLLSTLKLG